MALIVCGVLGLGREAVGQEADASSMDRPKAAVRAGGAPATTVEAAVGLELGATPATQAVDVGSGRAGKPCLPSEVCYDLAALCVDASLYNPQTGADDMVRLRAYAGSLRDH